MELYVGENFYFGKAAKAGPDYLKRLAILDNIIELRKTVARHTKCVICGAVDKSADDLGDSAITKMTKIDTDIDSHDDSSELRKTEYRPVPARPLNGFVVNNKVVCIACIRIMKGLAEKWP